jgi:hypothetical protein
MNHQRSRARVLIRIMAAAVAAVVLVIAVLAVPLAPTASARGGRTVLFGTVVGTPQGDQIDVATRSGVITLEIDEDTKVSGKKGKLSLSRVGAGMTVAGFYTEGDSGPVAGSLTFVGRKQKKSFKHLVGVIVDQSSSTFTVRTSSGDLVTVQSDDVGDSEFEPGSMIATVVETDEDTGDVTATALQTAKETGDRLSASISFEISNAQRDLLKIRMSQTATVHMTRLYETLGRIEADAQARIQAAYEEFQASYDATLLEASSEPVTIHVSGEVLNIWATKIHVLSSSDGTRWKIGITNATVFELVDGAEGTVHDFAAGQTIELITGPGSPPAMPVAKGIRLIPEIVPAGNSIFAPLPSDDTITGTIVVVDSGSGETGPVVVIVSDDGTDSAAALTDDTVIIVDGEELIIDELEAGQKVEIVLTDDGISAEEVTAAGSVEPTPIPGAETPSIASPPIEYSLVGILRSIGESDLVLDGVRLTLNDVSTNWDASTVGQEIELQFYVDDEGRLVVLVTK